MNVVALFYGCKSGIIIIHNYGMTFPTGLITTIGKFTGPGSRPVLFSGMSFFKLLFECADIGLIIFIICGLLVSQMFAMSLSVQK